MNIYSKLCTVSPITHNRKDQYFAALSSFIIVCLVFGAFVGQGLFSDVITFAKAGDQHLQCFPFFMKLGDWLRNGIFSGIDVNSFNGATEFAYRTNLPSQYVGLYPFALITKYFPARLMYILFFAVQLYFSLYFGQRLGQVYFHFSKWVSLLLAISSLTISLGNTYYISFYIVSTLVFPLIYFSLRLLDGVNKRTMLFLPLPFILAFTSGYVTVSVALVAFVMIFAFAYGWIARPNIKRSTVFWRLITPVAFATLICLLYYMQILRYANSVVQIEERLTSLAVVTDLKYSLSDLPFILTSSYLPTHFYEQMFQIPIGIMWACLLIGFMCGKQHSPFTTNEKVVMWFGVGASALIFVCALGAQTPLSAWFYSAVPVLGQMHLPIRYLVITMPMLYLALCIIVNKMSEDREGFSAKRIGITFCILAVVLAWVTGIYNFKTIDPSKLILELIMTGITLCFVGKYGWKHKVTLLAWSILLITLATNMFYSLQSVFVSTYTITDTSVMYNKEQQKTLDDFIESLPEQKIHKMVNLDSKGFVPYFFPNNYGWLDYTRRVISCYYGYEAHLSVPKEYMAVFPSYTTMNWQYIADTGGDFLVADSQSVENNKEALDKLINWEANAVYLGHEMTLYPLKSFVPVYYTQQPWVESPDNCLDNGYFYSPYLTNSDILNFDTNGANYFSIKVNCSKPVELLFQPFANRYFRYYVDGIEVEPKIESMKAFIPMPIGTHEVSIKYVNVIGELSNYVIYFYYFLCVVSAMILVLIKGKNKLRENGKAHLIRK